MTDNHHGSDVVVIGAGIMGAACARSLAAEGLSVTVLDRSGSAGGTSAASEGNLLVSDKTPGPELALAQHAAARWPGVVAELTEQLGPDFPLVEYEAKGGIVVATTDEDAAALTRFAAAQRVAGLESYELTPDQALILEPDLTRALSVAVHYPGDAQLQPTVTTEALLASARQFGATVRGNAEVMGPILAGDGRLVGVRTARGEFRARTVVLAAGPWAGTVSTRLGAPIPLLPRRGQLLVTHPMPQRIFHKVYDADYVGATQSGNVGLATSSVVESTPAGTVLIGSSREQVGFDDTLSLPVLRELALKAIRIFPFLAEVSVLRAYGGFRPYLPDHLPLIGLDHRREGLWHVGGHEGAGIGLSVASADLLTAQLLDRHSPVDVEAFQLQRPTLAEYLAVAEHRQPVP